MIVAARCRYIHKLSYASAHFSFLPQVLFRGKIPIEEHDRRHSPNPTPSLFIPSPATALHFPGDIKSNLPYPSSDVFEEVFTVDVACGCGGWETSRRTGSLSSGSTATTSNTARVGDGSADHAAYARGGVRGSRISEQSNNSNGGRDDDAAGVGQRRGGYPTPTPNTSREAFLTSQALFRRRRQPPEEKSRKREEAKTQAEEKEAEKGGREQRLIQQLQEAPPPQPVAVQQRRRAAGAGDSRQLSGGTVDETDNGSNEGNTTSSASVGDCQLVALETVEVASQDFDFVQGVYTKSCVFETGASSAGGNGDGRASWYMTENGEPVNEISYTDSVSEASIRFMSRFSLTFFGMFFVGRGNVGRV